MSIKDIANVEATLKEQAAAETVAEVVLPSASKEAVQTEAEAVAQAEGKETLAAGAKFNWINVAGAAVISAAGTAANMVIVNRTIDSLELANEKYSVLEILGVTATTAAVAAGAQAVLNTSSLINDDEMAGVLSTSLVANTAMVASAFTRDSALAGIRNLLAKKEEVVAAE